MKPQYYPLITVLAAAGLLLLPLCLVLMVTHRGSSFDGELDRQLAKATKSDPQSAPVATKELRTIPNTPIADKSPVAEIPPGAREAVASLVPAAPVPVQQPAAEHTSDMLTAQIPGDSAAGSELSGRGRPGVGEVVDEIGLRLPELRAAAGSYYDSTGHLALRNAGGTASDQPAAPSIKPDRDASRAFLSGSSARPVPEDSTAAGMIAGNVAPSPPGSRLGNDPGEIEKETANAGNERSSAGAGAGTRSRKSRSNSTTREDQVPLPPNNGLEDVVEDVLVQTPLENRMVNRVEDVIAVTRARGWPIALVRSDLPGDDWWVQQMVGISGNSFAARVNFGNENSISGSAYRMVFVFLDSPEEVRRFRIAKQFKEIPEGVRRSREYRYVRD